MSENIFVIDDEENIRFTFRKFLSDAGYSVKTAKNLDEALAKLALFDFDLIFADIVLNENSGIDILRTIKQKQIASPVVLITGYPDLHTASDAVRLGAFDYIYKPVEKDTLLRTAKLALQHKALLDENERYRRNLEAIFRSVQDAIITVDRDLKVVEVNAATQSILGFHREVIGRSFHDLPLTCGARCLEALEQTIEKKHSQKLFRLDCNRKDRSNLLITVNTSPLLDRKGNCRGAVLLVRDETRAAELENNLQARQRYVNIVGASKSMQKVYALIEYVKDVDTTILITGESGTGKELVVEALHYTGSRKDKPLVKVNLLAISEHLLESEIFGHVKGAFTGADHDNPGRFQLADGGTIFFDEIGDISYRMQLSLLRVLQERTFEKVGDATPVRVDVRIITATNQNLVEKIAQGKFRQDLYYRLKIVEISLPPLRDRKEDIPLLVDHFIDEFNRKLKVAIDAVSKEVLEMFMRYPWPGNVRELEHTLEHACILCRQGVVTTEHLPKEFGETIDGKGYYCIADDSGSERLGILRALETTDWNKAKTARLLGVGRRTLYRKIRKFNITR